MMGWDRNPAKPLNHSTRRGRVTKTRSDFTPSDIGTQHLYPELGYWGGTIKPWIFLSASLNSNAGAKTISLRS